MKILLHPYNWAENKELIEFSYSQGIVTEAYTSLAYVHVFLGKLRLLTCECRPITRFPGGPIDPVLQTIGKRIGGTPAQVIFKWLQSKGVVIVTSVTYYSVKATQN